MRARPLLQRSVAFVVVGLGVVACASAFAACSSSTPATADASVDTGKDGATAPTDAGTVADGLAPLPRDAGTDAQVRDSSVEIDAGDGSVQDASIADAADAAPAPMVLTSGTLTDNGRFPAAHTCNGANGSPPLTWTAGPPGTNSYAVVMKDLTVPNQHWTLYDIPSTTLALAANVPNGYSPAAPAPVGSKHGTVTFSPATFGYLGPCPPRPGDHDYVFTVYALTGATVAGAAQSDTPEVLETKIKAQKVNAGAEASLRSKYKQP